MGNKTEMCVASWIVDKAEGGVDHILSPGTDASTSLVQSLHVSFLAPRCKPAAASGR